MKKLRFVFLILGTIVISAFGLAACGNKGPVRTVSAWDEVFDRAANEISSDALLSNSTSNFIRDTFLGDTYAGTIKKSANAIEAQTYYGGLTNINYYLVENGCVNFYYSLGHHGLYGMQSDMLPETTGNNNLITFFDTAEQQSVTVDALPYRQLKGKYGWFKYQSGTYVLKNDSFAAYNAMYLEPHLDSGRVTFNIKELSFKISGGRITEHYYKHEYVIDGRHNESSARFVYQYGNTPQIEIPEVSSDNGVFVLHILFGFSAEQIEFLNSSLTGDTAADKEIYDDVAQAVTSGGRSLFGGGGIYEELASELSSLRGEEAIALFNDYMHIYNGDPGMLGNEDGYFVPLSGFSPYVQPFTDLSRALFIDSNPEASIGNAFINERLAYCVSEFGVHIVMIRSYKE